MDRRDALIRKLEDRFRRIATVLYDTRIHPEEVDRELAPFLADDIRFTDPWQRETGREKYRLGAAGFHAMFRFEFEAYQVGVQLTEEGARGRAIVDGVMQLRQFERLFVYPLRTILTFEFRLTGETKDGEPTFLIYDHDEMWSFGDMLAAVPGFGRFYARFRRVFSAGFLVASRFSARRKKLLPKLESPRRSVETSSDDAVPFAGR